MWGFALLIGYMYLKTGGGGGGGGGGDNATLLHLPYPQWLIPSGSATVDRVNAIMLQRSIHNPEGLS